MDRVGTGIPELDELLGGGLLPGTLTVAAGATGVGKTQLGLHFAHAGQSREGERGVILDLTTRGDAQNHGDYAARMFDWRLKPDVEHPGFTPADIWSPDAGRSDFLHLFARSGRRVTRSTLDPDEQREFHLELVKKLQRTIRFFYGNFVNGVRRCVIDGVEPTNSPGDSFQFDLFEYIYHQILRKDADWVARDLFRESFRSQADEVQRRMYDHTQLACLLLFTTHEVMLDDLLKRPLDSGDVLSNANTIILLGKTRGEGRMGRALHVAKHRGSRLDERIVPFTISDAGLSLQLS
jgi:KaiC/GvpD/RAD55 family RecA-like ATPase